MTKKLIFVCGSNGVGKSSTCRELVNYIDGSAYVDSDWCTARNPFMLNDETIDIVKQSMQFMLIKYLECFIYDNVIWSYGLHGHRKDVFKRIMEALRNSNVEFNFIPIILTCDISENIKRMKNDNRDDGRIERAIRNTRELYNDYPFPKINTTHMTIKETIGEMKKIIDDVQNLLDEKVIIFDI